MKSKEGHTVSIGPLAVADTRLTATVLPIPVWGTFIAWASFFILGDRKMGLLQSIASIGAVVSSLTLLAISSKPADRRRQRADGPGVERAVAKHSSRHRLGLRLDVETTGTTGKPITTLGIDNPALIAATALIVGGLFGYVSELLGRSAPTRTRSFPGPSQILFAFFPLKELL